MFIQDAENSLELALIDAPFDSLILEDLSLLFWFLGEA